MALEQPADRLQHRVLEHGLDRACEVLTAARRCELAHEAHDLAIAPEIRAYAPGASEGVPATNPLRPPRLPARREAGDLAFVAHLAKAERLCGCAVGRAEA